MAGADEVGGCSRVKSAAWGWLPSLLVAVMGESNQADAFSVVVGLPVQSLRRKGSMQLKLFPVLRLPIDRANGGNRRSP